MSKNIETCKSEEVLSSVLDQQPQDYPSVQQAVHDLGVTALPAASAADPDIAELPSNVEVFVRRVLKAVVYERVLPVVQQMWQAVWPRFADYLPDSLRPYAQDPSLRTLGTLPTALSALSSRKISDLGDCPDGISFVHLAAGYNGVTELKDDNRGWTMSRALPTMSSVTKATIGCKTLHAAISGSLPNAEELNFPDLDHIDTSESGHPQTNIFYGSKLKKVWMPALKRFYVVNASYSGVFYNLTGPCEILAENCTYWDSREGGGYPVGLHTVPGLRRMVLGTCTRCHIFTSNTGAINLIDLELGAGTACNMNHGYWNPTNALSSSASDLVADPVAHPTWKNLDQFLQNFLHHIAERLAVGPTTNRLTLTLSADVYSACGFGATIDDTTDIRYQIKKAIQDRNWKVTDGTNNFNQ